MRYKLLFLLLLLTQRNVFAQSTIDKAQQYKQLYEAAYIEMAQMLQGQKPISFKRAVFLMENAYLNNAWTYDKFNNQPAGITTKLKQMISERHIEQYKTAGNWAAFTYMEDSVKQNNYKPYSYDFDNYLPDKDPTVSFITKLLTTNKAIVFLFLSYTKYWFRRSEALPALP